MAKQPGLLYVGIDGSVVALDRTSGEIVWSVRLRKGSTLVPILRDDRNLYALSGGEVTCLDPASGEVRWHNPLKGYRTGLATFAQDLPSIAPLAAAHEAQAAAAAAISTSS